MIMEKFRGGRFIKIVMAGVIIAFVATIFFSWGMDVTSKRAQKRVVVDLGDRKITMEEYGKLLDQRINMMREQSGGYPTAFEINKLKKELAEGLVYQHLRDKTIKDLGITAAPVEIIDYMKKNAPEGIKMNENFQTNGVFDSSKYNQFIESSEAFDNPGIVNWEYQLKMNEIPNAKLQSLVASSGKPNKLELKDQITRKLEKADVEYVYVPVLNIDLGADTATLADVQKYYKTNKDSFKIEESAELEYISIPKVAGEDDRKEALNQITEVYKKAIAGEDFSDLAKMYSDDDENAPLGGTLGKFGKNTMLKEFEDATWALSEGEISKPVETTHGYHIIKLNKRYADVNEVEAQHILIKIRVGIGTQENLRSSADLMKSELLGNKDMEKVAKAKNFFFSKTGLFPQDGDIPGFSTKETYIPELKTFTFDKDNPEKVKVFDNDKSFFVFRVARRASAGYKSIEDVKASVIATLNNQKKMEKAKTLVSKVKDAAKDGKALSEAKSVESAAEFGEKKAVSRMDYIPMLGTASEAVFAAFAKSGEVVGPYEVTSGAVIAKATNLVKAEKAEVDKQLNEMMTYYGYQLQNKVMNEWYTHLRENSGAKIDLMGMGN